MKKIQELIKRIQFRYKGVLFTAYVEPYFKSATHPYILTKVVWKTNKYFFRQPLETNENKPVIKLVRAKFHSMTLGKRRRRTLPQLLKKIKKVSQEETMKWESVKEKLNQKNEAK